MAEEIEFPISLESIMSMDINYENLKSVLEFIIDKIRDHDDTLETLTKTSLDSFVTLDKFNLHLEEFNDVKTGLNPLKERSIANYELMTNLEKKTSEL